jgi:hypothetical protein
VYYIRRHSYDMNSQSEVQVLFLDMFMCGHNKYIQSDFAELLHDVCCPICNLHSSIFFMYSLLISHSMSCLTPFYLFSHYTFCVKVQRRTDSANVLNAFCYYQHTSAWCFDGRVLPTTCHKHLKSAAPMSPSDNQYASPCRCCTSTTP